jgi:hypothetical protein
MDKIITEPSINIFIGRPKSGKSNLQMKIIKDLWENEKISYIVVFCSPDVEHNYKEWIPHCFIYTAFNIKLVHKVVLQQREYNEGTSRDNKDDDEQRTKAVIIFDDIGAYKGQFKTDKMAQLITTASHSGLYLFISVQYARMVHPDVYACAEYYWIFPQFGEAENNAVFKYCGKGYTYSEFVNYIDEMTIEKTKALTKEEKDKYRYVLLFNKNDLDKPFRCVKYKYQYGFYLTY